MAKKSKKASERQPVASDKARSTSVSVENLRSGAETATLLGISTKWLRELAQRGVLPRANGKYPWPAVRVAFNNYLESKGEDQSQNGRLKEERAALVRVQREIAEIELARKRESLLTVKDFDEVLDHACAVLRSRIIAVPSKHAWRFEVCETIAEAKEYLDGIADELLEDLCHSMADNEAQQQLRQRQRERWADAEKAYLEREVKKSTKKRTAAKSQ